MVDIKNELKKNKNIYYFLETQVKTHSFLLPDVQCNIHKNKNAFHNLVNETYFLILKTLINSKFKEPNDSKFLLYFDPSFETQSVYEIEEYNKVNNNAAQRGLKRRDKKELFLLYKKHYNNIEEFLYEINNSSKTTISFFNKNIPVESFLFFILASHVKINENYQSLFNLHRRINEVKEIKNLIPSIMKMFKQYHRDEFKSNVIFEKFNQEFLIDFVFKDGPFFVFLNDSGIISKEQFIYILYNMVISGFHKFYVFFPRYNEVVEFKNKDVFYDIDDIENELLESYKNFGKIKFNQAQKDFIKAKAPVLSIAGPGSGKTETLITKVAEEIKYIGPSKFLLLTFTKKAANEMTFRLQKKVGFLGDVSNIGTFHSVFFKFLKSTIFKDWHLIHGGEDLYLFKKAISIIENIPMSTDFNQYTQTRFSERLDDLKSSISMSIYNCNINKKDISTFVADIYGVGFGKITKEYLKLKEKEKALNFDDILRYTLKALKENTSFRKRIQDRFNTIYVDEFQDTNLIQFEILKYIHKKRNIVVVGDPNQSIYAFMNARLDNVMSFYEEFEPQIIQLNINYRSTKNIVTLTNMITDEFEYKMKFNGSELKKLKSNIKYDGPPITLFSTNRRDLQALTIIKELISTGTELEDIAVLVRKNRDLSKLETALNKEKINFIKKMPGTFYEKKEVKSLINLFLFYFDRKDYNAFKYFFENMYMIGNETTDSIIQVFKKNNEEITSYGIKSNLNLLKYKRHKEVINILEIIEDWSTSDFSGFETLLDKMKFKEQMIVGIKKEEEVELVIDNMAVIIEELESIYTSNEKDKFRTEIDSLILSKEESTEILGAVTLSTAHSAKGLEWEHVIVMDVSKNNFTECREDFWELNDEQIRLLYVTVSRAKSSLYLIHQKENITNKKPKPLDRIIHSVLLKNEKIFEKYDTEY